MSATEHWGRARACWLLVLVAIIALGLLSRRMAWLPNSVGDMCWAMMVFCLVRLLFVRWRTLLVVATALGISFAVEFSQLIRWSWLCRFRSTFVGHMLLGQGFMWQDLVAYALGVGLICLPEIWLAKHWRSSLIHKKGGNR